MVNSWLLYKRDAEALRVQRKDLLGLAAFKLKVAFAVMHEGKVPRRGRPSNENPPVKKQCFVRPGQPEDSVRFDQVAHFPIIENERRICRVNGCEGRTNVQCNKCKVHLCLSNKKNHFFFYHNK